MTISKAIVTAASPNQRALPLQTLVDRDGHQKPVLRIIIEEARRADINDICVVVSPGDENTYRQAAGEQAGLTFVVQSEPRGYAHAVLAARDFAADEPFLHMIGDHVYAGTQGSNSAQQLVAVAQAQGCSVSAVQATRENLLPFFGTVGGNRIKGTRNLYAVESVAEKPTPTEAEQTLMVPGLRMGHYLCFFGMHVLTPLVMEILEEQLARSPHEKLSLSPALNELAGREKYLAFEAPGRRYPLDRRYGLLYAQLALALEGHDREQVLTTLCELLAQGELAQGEMRGEA